MQAIHDELNRLVELSLVCNLTAPRNEDLVVAELGFTSAVNWITIRGTSDAHHGTDLATALYRPFDRWCLKQDGFTIDDVLHIGEAVQALLTRRMNSLQDEAWDFAEQVQTHASSPAAHDNLTAEESAKLDSPEQHALPRAASIDRRLRAWRTRGHELHPRRFDRRWVATRPSGSGFEEKPFLRWGFSTQTLMADCSTRVHWLSIRSLSSTDGLFSLSTGWFSETPCCY